MRCPKCGNEVEASRKFCTDCGAAVRAPVTPVTPVIPVVPIVPASAPRKSRAWKAVAIVALAVLVVGGVATGIILWRAAAGNRLVAQVTSVDLGRKDGESIDLEKVPLDDTLVLEATYRASFPQGGSGTLSLTLTDSAGDELMEDTFEVRSGGGLQKKKAEFHLTQSDGKPLKAKASLEVEQGARKASGGKTLTCTAVKGKGKEVLFTEAKDAATKKLSEATGAVKELTDAGIDTSDLVAMLSDALGRLEAAKTAEQATEAGALADAVLKECQVRKASYNDAQAREADIAAAQQVMYDYAWAERGNSETVSLVDFSMNNERTQASATFVGPVTAHTDPDNAGMTNYFYLTAQKQGGQWVVTGFRYEHVI